MMQSNNSAASLERSQVDGCDEGVGLNLRSIPNIARVRRAYNQVLRVLTLRNLSEPVSTGKHPCPTGITTGG